MPKQNNCTWRAFIFVFFSFYRFVFIISSYLSSLYHFILVTVTWVSRLCYFFLFWFESCVFSFCTTFYAHKMSILITDCYISMQNDLIEENVHANVDNESSLRQLKLFRFTLNFTRSLCYRLNLNTAKTHIHRIESNRTACNDS